MHFAATLPGRSLPDVLKFALSKGVDASLEVSGPELPSTVWLKAGHVVFAQSAGSLALTEALNRLALLPDETLALLRQEQPPYIEDVLVDRQLIQPQVITYVRAFQIAETIYQILEWEKAGFELREGTDATPLRLVHPGYLPQNYDWLAEISQYGHTWPAIRQSIGSGRTILAKGPNAEPEQVTPQERKLLDLIDGRRSVQSTVLWSGMNFIVAHRLLTDLADRLVISPKDGTRPGGKPPNDKAISQVLQNVICLPGGQSAWLVDRKGHLIAQAHAEGHGDDDSAMASILARTVSDFEQHLHLEEQSRKIEQLLVEHRQGSRTVLVVTHRVILAVEASQDCDWGLIRLEAGRAIKALWPHLGG